MAKANTSPGRDRLSYELFKHLDNFVLDVILALVNSVSRGMSTEGMEACSGGPDLKARQRGVESKFLPAHSAYISALQNNGEDGYK